jgi:hypothetical protein
LILSGLTVKFSNLKTLIFCLYNMCRWTAHLDGSILECANNWLELIMGVKYTELPLY